MLIAGLLLSPWWIPGLAGWILGDRGLQWEDLETTGYRKWVIREMRLSRPGLEMRLDRLEIPQPLEWIDTLLASGDHPVIQGGRLRVRLIESERTGGDGPPGPAETAALYGDLAGILGRIPEIRLERLEIGKVAGFEPPAVTGISLQGSRLAARIDGAGSLPALRVGILAGREALRAAAVPAGPGSPDLRLVTAARIRADAVDLSGILYSDGVPLGARARLEGTDWILSSLSLEADGWPVPDRLAGTGTRGATADLRVSGDRTRLSVLEFSLQTGWLTAWLADPFRFDMESRSFDRTAALSIRADLHRQEWMNATGLLHISAMVRDPAGGKPDADFTLNGTDLTFGGFSIEEVRASGTYRIEDRHIESEGRVRIDPGFLEKRAAWLQIEERLQVSFRASGKPDNLAHSGSLDPVKAHVKGLHPLTLAAGWKGRGVDSAGVDLRLESETGATGECTLEWSAAPSGQAPGIRIGRAVISSSGGATARLSAPAGLVLRPGDPVPVDSLSRTRFETDGEPYLEVGLDRGRGHLHIDGRGVQTGLLADWLTGKPPEWLIRNLKLASSRLEPGLSGDFRLELEGEGGPLETFTLKLGGEADPSGVRFSEIEALTGDVSIASGVIGFPVQFHPFGFADGRLLTISGSGRPEGWLKTEITPRLASGFAGLPWLEHLVGTTVDLNIDEALALSATMEAAGLKLQGRAPIEPLYGWKPGRDIPYETVLREASLNLDVENLKLEAFKELVPGYMRPTGFIDGQLNLEPGFRLSGRLLANGFSLRPTLVSKSIDQISLTLDFEGSRMTLAGASARIGDGRVELTGFLDLAELDRPEWSFNLTGQKTPVVRTPDMLLRADLDLRMDSNGPGGAPAVTGSVAFQDSVVLVDIDPLAARTAGGALPAPPFFSVGEAPFSKWNLEVAVRGRDAIRLRSQYLATLMSVNMDLGGTLGNPVLVGGLSAREGRIAFPGTQMRLTRSEIFVTRDNQDQIQLDLTASGRTSSHVVTMQVDGTVRDPHVTFASTPSLPNARILQLLATGSLSNSGGGGNLGLYLGRGLVGPAAGEGLLDRLSVEFGRDVSESGKKTVDIQYDLTESLRLRGTYDRYDTRNLDLEWEVFSE